MPFNLRKSAHSIIQSHPRAIAILLGCIIALIVIFCLEYGLRIYYSSDSYKSAKRNLIKRGGDYATKGFFQYDKNLGYKPKPSVQMSSIKKYDDGMTIYNVVYSTDEYSRRITPIDSSTRRNKFIIFFGCSTTFGEGLNDNETLPYFVGKFAPHYQPYNFAGPGYGPQQMLAKLQQKEITKEINQKEGIAICVGGSILRAIGAMNIYNGWGHNMPYYTTNQHGQIIRKGDFTSGRPTLSYLYRTLGKSAIVRRFRINHPFRISEDNINLTALIILEAQKVFLRDFNSSKFYFVSRPGSSGSNKKKLVSRLKKAGVKCLDYSELTRFSGKEYHILGDGHPTARWNRELAKLIVDDLKLDKNE